MTEKKTDDHLPLIMGHSELDSESSQKTFFTPNYYQTRFISISIMKTISFNPKTISKKLLSGISDRARDVVVKRFGLESEKGLTLEAIGQEYGITRERVRQIENAALAAIRKSEHFEKANPVFEELREVVAKLGAIVPEDELLSYVSSDPNIQNHITFFLVLGDPFMKEKENAEFRHRWITDAEIARRVEGALREISSSIDSDALVPESELIGRFLDALEDVADDYKNEDNALRWLKLAKTIDKNPLGEWGSAESASVRAKSIRDLAYLIIRREGNPMHFSEVAKAIEETFGRKAHKATCHNELIKDSRFVLVGRGLYALTDWGYMPGVVHDVIRQLLEKHGPLTRDEIVDFVLKERYVKPNTIIVNLQNPKYFNRDTKGRYSIA
jgi:hypothetical protein